MTKTLWIQMKNVNPCHAKKNVDARPTSYFLLIRLLDPDWWYNFTYRIQPNYHTMCLGFSKMLGKLVVKYMPTYTKGTLKKKKKILQRIYQMMLMLCFVWFFFSDFLYKSICYGQFIDAIQMGTHNIYLYEKVDKNTLAVIWRLQNCLTMRLQRYVW